MKIPLVDLKSQHLNLKEELTHAINNVISETAFIGGKAVRKFEEQFADFCEVGYVTGASNGTDALYIALWALGISPGDEVILPAHSFVATSEAVRLLGATPVFVDIQEETFNIDPDAVAASIGPRTKAIVAVHLYGRPAPMVRLVELAQRHGLALVGDGAQVHGAQIGTEAVAKFGDATAFSFYPGKNLGAFGDAGAIATNDFDLAVKMKKLTDHGRGGSKYLHECMGTNARLDGLQAAILSVKLKYLEKWCQMRQHNAEAYNSFLSDLDQITTPQLPVGVRQHAMHLYVLRVPASERDSLFKYLRERGIEAGIHYPIPLHLQPCNSDLNYTEGCLPVTERVAKEIISLPMYPELRESEIAFVSSAVKDYFKGR